jgi:hypothetical protein
MQAGTHGAAGGRGGRGEPVAGVAEDWSPWEGRDSSSAWEDIQSSRSWVSRLRAGCLPIAPPLRSEPRPLRPPKYVSVPVSLVHAEGHDAAILTLIRVLGLCWKRGERQGGGWGTLLPPAPSRGGRRAATATRRPTRRRLGCW